MDNLTDPDFYLHRERIGKPVRDKIPQIIVSDGKARLYGYSIDDLMKVHDEKRENRGGFKEKFFWAGNE